MWKRIWKRITETPRVTEVSTHHVEVDPNSDMLGNIVAVLALHEVNEAEVL